MISLWWSPLRSTGERRTRPAGPRVAISGGLRGPGRAEPYLVVLFSRAGRLPPWPPGAQSSLGACCALGMIGPCLPGGRPPGPSACGQGAALLPTVAGHPAYGTSIPASACRQPHKGRWTSPSHGGQARTGRWTVTPCKVANPNRSSPRDRSRHQRPEVVTAGRNSSLGGCPLRSARLRAAGRCLHRPAGPVIRAQGCSRHAMLRAGSPRSTRHGDEFSSSVTSWGHQ